MATRLELHEKLQELIGLRPDGKPNVYFQPPETLKLNYPCIVYGFSDYNIRHSDNRIYKKIKQYTISLLETDPDSSLADRILESFSMISFDRSYPAGNLYHRVFSLYF